ncbi:uncharacterized protein LOC111784482 [Cucurbita pepo subsp. pepo]|uniref:uncharacterized protein LOC111784325 n=1 Tax=Cucurbita pepo subsp. pepo TaxID=3664 RepID=UPI000C9D84F6|nr:uncharacterized protein LOC111784325 [Cucurbita pepo subsp. pepo]XP_023520944.1 uncharacterized protein LOC111784482 [Cucurbita pepo subsp. pepo]
MASFLGSNSPQVSSLSSLEIKFVGICGNYQIDRRPASPGRSISVQKNRDGNANAVASSNKRKWCMCSPSTHPASFRCSLHNKKSRHSVNALNRSEFSNGSLDFRRSAMTNSIARIGGVEGADLVKRALSALIRPSSHQLRPRSAFQPRPSRLSVMSKAEQE